MQRSRDWRGRQCLPSTSLHSRFTANSPTGGSACSSIHSLFRESLVNDFEETGDQDNVFEDQSEKDIATLEEKENTDIEDDLCPEWSLTEDILARPRPKIWISKSASMEHDLD